MLYYVIDCCFVYLYNLWKLEHSKEKHLSKLKVKYDMLKNVLDQISLVALFLEVEGDKERQESTVITIYFTTTIHGLLSFSLEYVWKFYNQNI